MAGLGFLKKGKAAHEAVAQADAETEARKKSAASTHHRFWLPSDAETSITFLDGALTEDGLLDTVAYYEHQVKLNGHWRNWFPCVADQEPCPICDLGDHPSLVSLFTIIDHTYWKDGRGAVHQHERKLFACKRETLKMLQKKATKYGGLAGITFDVSRVGAKAANVGNDFDYLEKHSPVELAQKYQLPESDVGPYIYDTVIKYYPAEELKKLGFGIGTGVGAEDVEHQTGPAKEPDYDKAL